MKKIIDALAALTCASAFAQVPQGILGNPKGPQAMPGPANGRYGMMKTNSAVSAVSLATELR